ncbi:MAG: TetR family transcriptional regulator [bacterium]
MTEKQQKDAKQRIFDAAISLFARKGYNAVGTRGIVKKAQVNIAMINYYYGGKVGILKTIINTAYEKHSAVITSADVHQEPENHIQAVIENFIKFFRGNTELALVAFDTLPYDDPEIIALKQKWEESKMDLVRKLFAGIGLNINNEVQVSIFNGFLSNIILTHFRGRYSWEQAAGKSALAYDDVFYARYAKTLARFYFDGVRGVISKRGKKK